MAERRTPPEHNDVLERLQRMSIGDSKAKRDIYVIGGIAGAKCDEKLSYGGGRLGAPVTICPLNRKYFAVAVVKGQLYAVGGRNEANVPLNTVARLDGNKWTILPLELHDNRSECGVTVVKDVIYITGGYDKSCLTAETLDPIANVRSRVPNMGQGRWGHGTVTIDRKVYVIGGHRFKTYFNSVECFDVITQKWRSCEGMNRRRAYFGAVVVKGFIYVFGGFGGCCNSQDTVRLDSIERYDSVNDEWTEVAFLESPRSNLSACLLTDTKVVISGGLDDCKKKINEAEIFNTEDWSTTKCRLSSWRFAHCMAGV